MSTEQESRENNIRKVSLEASISMALEESEAVFTEAQKELEGSIKKLEEEKKKYEELMRKGTVTEGDKRFLDVAEKFVAECERYIAEARQLHLKFINMRNRYLGKEDLDGSPLIH